MSWSLLQNSLLVGLLSTALAASLGFLAALAACSWGRQGRHLFSLGAIGTLALPPFLAVNCWLDLLGYTGTWRRWSPWDIYSLGGVIWILGLMLWPLTLFGLLGAWQRLDSSQLESEPALGGWALIKYLLLPLGRTALGQTSVLTFVLALNNFAVPALILAPLPVKVFPAELWVNFNTTFDYAAAARLSLPLILAPLALLVFLHRREMIWPALERLVPAPIFRRRLGRFWQGASVLGTATALGFGLVLPLYQLSASGRTWLQMPSALAAGQSAVVHSFLFAAASATIVVALALATWRWRLGTILWLPFFIPGVLLGIGFIYLFNRAWLALFYQSAWIVIAALTVRYLALGWNGVAYLMRSADPALTDAARLEGASRWQLIRYVHGPYLVGPVAAAWYIIYILCLWDVETLLMILPPGGETLASRVFNLLHYGHNAQVNALCLVLLLLACMPWLFWRCGRGLMLRVWRRPRFSWVLGQKWSGMGLLGIGLLISGCSGSNGRRLPQPSQLFSEVQVIGARGTGLGQFNKPRSVAVDRDDHLYVVDMTGRVQKFAPDGTFVMFWQMPQTEKGKPKGMCRDAEGNIVVIEPHYSRLNHYSTGGQLLSQWGRHGTNAGQVAFPRSAAVNSRGEIYVTEYGIVERVQRFAGRDSRFLSGFGRPGSGPGEFNRPEGLGIDWRNRVYVADSCNHRIQIFNESGRFLRDYGRAGKGTGELSYPYDVQIDAEGRQFVCEFGNSRVQIFDPQDRPLEILGRPGASPGEFSNPWSLALDSAGNLYVADSQNHRVQKFIRRTPVPRAARASRSSSGENGS